MNEIVFISHSSADNDVTRKIYERLEKRGIRCWFDRAELDTDASQSIDYGDAIVRAIKNASVFVLIFTANANRSVDIRREVCVAGNEVCNGMKILPFSLTDETPNFSVYYRLVECSVFKGEGLPAKDEEIEGFCDLVESAVREMEKKGDTRAADQMRLKMLEKDISNEERTAVDTYVESTPLPQITRLLVKAREDSDEHYRANSDPYLEYKYFNEYMIGDFFLRDVAKSLFSHEKYSIALGKLYRHVAYFLINGGKLGHVREARNYLEDALDVFEALYDRNPDDVETIVEEIVMCRWLLSITHKQERNLGLSIEVLESLLAYAKQQYESYGLDYSKTVLLPRREIAIVNQSEEDFISLMNDAPLYADNPEETFFTYRRAFEFFCEQGLEEQATELLPKLMEAYKACAGALYGVYDLALELNRYQYLCAFGDKEKARELYEELREKFESQHFERYLERLEKIHAQVSRNRTLRVEVS